MKNATEPKTTPLFDEKSAKRLFYFTVFIALFTIVLAILAHLYGQYISDAGHSASTTQREIVIANDVLMIEDNHIRFSEQRVSGVHGRIDLYAVWPSLSGYTEALADNFNNIGDEKSLIFMTLEPARMSRDMTGRLEPIYRGLMLEPSAEGDYGLTINALKDETSNNSEWLYVGQEIGQRKFVARCLSGTILDTALAPCERDVQFESGLSLTYRFPAHLLEHWRILDQKFMQFIQSRRMNS